MMTIEEIEMTLPNGFHDACIEKLNIDYDKQEARIELLIDVSSPQLHEKKMQSMPRKGTLTLSGLLFFVIEPPDHQYFSQNQKAERLWIADSGPVASSKKLELLSAIPTASSKNIFSHYFFIRNWNSFIIVAAAEARFE